MLIKSMFTQGWMNSEPYLNSSSLNMFTRNRINVVLEVLSSADGVSKSPCEIVLKKTSSSVHMTPSHFRAIPVQNET